MVLAGATSLLLGSAPPRDLGAEAKSWDERAGRRIEELDGLGVDVEPYRAVRKKCAVLVSRGFLPEAIENLHHLVRDLEGWDPAPHPPRRPAEALLDSAVGPVPWDPGEHGPDILTGSVGFGRWQRPGPGWRRGDDPPVDGALDGDGGVGRYRRVEGKPFEPTLGSRVRDARVRETAHASRTQAAQRRIDWIEEAARSDGAVMGAPRERLGGGQVLSGEHLGGDPADEDALRGPQGVGYYGSPLRMARVGVVPLEAPDLADAEEGPDDPAGYGGYRPGVDPRPRRSDPDPEPLTLDDEDLEDETPGDLARVERPDPDPGTTPEVRPPDLDDRDDDLGLDDDPEFGDEPAPVPSRPDPTRTPVSPPPATPPPAAGPDPFAVTDEEEMADVEELGMQELFLASPAQRSRRSGTRIRVQGRLGARRRDLEPHVRVLAGRPDMKGLILATLSEGALGIDVLLRESDVEDLVEEETLLVEGRYLAAPDDKTLTDSNRNQLLVAHRVTPLDGS